MRKLLFAALACGWLAALVWVFATASPYIQGLLAGFVFCAAAFVVPMVSLLRTLPDRGAALDELDDDDDDDDGGALLVPDGWEYETSITREVDDSGLVYEERFTLLVPRPGRVVRVERPQTKQLTVGRDS